MKNLLVITALAFPPGIFAQGPNTNIHPPPQALQMQNINYSEDNNNKPCNDCDEVKQAIKSLHTSSGGPYHKKSCRMKKQNHKFSGRITMKMKRMFTHRKKIRPDYEICFRWG